MTLQENHAIRLQVKAAIEKIVPKEFNCNFYLRMKVTKAVSDDLDRAKEIQKLVCSFYNVHIKDVEAKNRKREIVTARRGICLMCKRYTFLSLENIADFAGYKGDHTNVIHCLQVAEDFFSVDPSYVAEIDALDSYILTNTTK
ncbi:MAG: helix-turn-helix domain-containing protein [Ferruginibacter sp.]